MSGMDEMEGSVHPVAGVSTGEPRPAAARRIKPVAKSTLRPFRRTVASRALSGVFAGLNRVIAWHRLPKFLGLLNLIPIRDELRAKNLYDTTHLPSTQAPEPPSWDPELATRRAADGTYNDLSNPRMGAAGTRFGRNVPLENAWPEPEPALLEPSPRVISNRLLARQSFVPATSLNLLAAAWIQFMTHDWFDHGSPKRGGEFKVPLDKERGDSWSEDPMRIRRTPEDPTRIPGAKDGPPTYINQHSQWWDASQIYGSNEEETRALRCTDDEDGGQRRGKLILVGEGMEAQLPVDPNTHLQKSGVTHNWWIGLSLLHTTFAKEHNAIVDRLRLEFPDWDGDRLFHTARLINTALMAKIHTIEWTPAILAHPTTETALNTNWWGLVGQRVTRLFGRMSRSELISGIPGSEVNHHGVPFALTEEFVAVYRMHSLIPDTMRLHRMRDGVQVREVAMVDIAGPNTLKALEGGLTMVDLCYSFGISHPGALVLHNYPAFLRDLHRQDPDGTESRVDLASIDVMRDRERGVPRYNAFRKLMHLQPARTFKDITRNEQWARELREVYGHVDRVDLLVGMLAEDPPRGFGFSDTAFRVFILMASRRLASDRFFTNDQNVNLYTQPGMAWLNENTMASVLLRHYPGLAPALRLTRNAFAPWEPVSMVATEPPAGSLLH
ncbi:peroxidase family protein [Myxococcus xanthus]|uniref:peroxidase family protein n=1 Tax=Myxococcus xanthus TaxID=34 RepID=UPI001CECE4AB|nr:peroxidase family protein [Myxococcus xanthus]